jgi:sterol desaturase/sphingolipid hydroxylase (fatty acid hydroxylase superfamily)
MIMAKIIILFVIATLPHAMALFWYLAGRNKWKVCERTIYDLPIDSKQIRRELKTSMSMPIHAVILGTFVYLGFFRNESVSSGIVSALITTIWAEIWHYGSHRAFHLSALHWIHVEHHRSLLNSPFTAISFSFWEKLIFALGIVAPLAALDCFVSLNFFGIGGWYIGYLIVTSFSHANFELRSYNPWVSSVLTTTTYHSLHHSRYTGNYGLGTRVLDRIFQTEWNDYDALYDRIAKERRPLTKLREKASG